MNGTINGSSCHSSFYHPAAKTGQAFAYCFILVASLIGNCLIAMIVYKTRTMRKPINYFIVNMAMSDLLYPIFLIPRILTQLLVGSWLIGGPLGHALCKLINTLSVVSLDVSAQSLVLIAVDRFGAVVFPLRSSLISSKRCRFLILATWIIAMCFHSPFLLAFKVIENPGQVACVLQWNKELGRYSSLKNYLLVTYVVFLYIPIVLLTTLYSIILYNLKSQKIPGEQSASAQEQRSKRNRNVIKMAIAIVLGFAICWVPFSIFLLILFFVWNKQFPCGIFHNVNVIISFIAYANSVINPIICFSFSENYRQGFRRLCNCFRT